MIDDNEILEMVKNGKLILAIKKVREQSGMSLGDAKAYVDRLAAGQHQTANYKVSSKLEVKLEEDGRKGFQRLAAPVLVILIIVLLLYLLHIFNVL